MTSFASPFLKPPPAYVASERTRRRIAGMPLYEAPEAYQPKVEAPPHPVPVKREPKPHFPEDRPVGRPRKPREPNALSTALAIKRAVSEAFQIPSYALSAPQPRGGKRKRLTDAKAMAVHLTRQLAPSLTLERIAQLFGYQSWPGVRAAGERAPALLAHEVGYQRRYASVLKKLEARCG